MSENHLEGQRAEKVTVNLDNIRAEADIELQYLDLRRQQADARFAAAHLLSLLAGVDETVPEPGRDDLKQWIVDLAAGLGLNTEGLVDLLEPKCPFNLAAEESGRCLRVRKGNVPGQDAVPGLLPLLDGNLDRAWREIVVKLMEEIECCPVGIDPSTFDPDLR